MKRRAGRHHRQDPASEGGAGGAEVVTLGDKGSLSFTGPGSPPLGRSASYSHTLDNFKHRSRGLPVADKVDVAQCYQN